MVIPRARDHRTNGVSPSSWYVAVAMCSLTWAKRSGMSLTSFDVYRPRDEALANDFIVKAFAAKRLSTNIVSPGQSSVIGQFDFNWFSPVCSQRHTRGMTDRFSPEVLDGSTVRHDCVLQTNELYIVLSIGPRPLLLGTTSLL